MRLTSHVRFGGGPLEKGLVTGTSLAAYPTARRVRAGGHWKRNRTAETSPVAYRYYATDRSWSASSRSP
jgi:hypothetical protein